MSKPTTPEQRAKNAAYMRQWRLDHLPSEAARGKRYRERFAEQIKARKALFRKAHADELRASDRARWDKVKYRAQWRRRTYGLSQDDIRDMEVGQAGRCLICLRVPEKPLRVDHDHATGRVRGLLCERCNLALGHLRDDSASAARAARYLATPAS